MTSPIRNNSHWAPVCVCAYDITISENHKSFSIGPIKLSSIKDRRAAIVNADTQYCDVTSIHVTYHIESCYIEFGYKE